MPPARCGPTATIGELVRSGLVTIAQAPMRLRLDLGDVPVLTSWDVAAQREPSGRTVDEPGLVRLEPGDVVAPVCGGKDAAVQVVARSGDALSPRLLGLRVDPEMLDPEFLAGHVRAASATGTARAGSTVSRTDARRISLPVLPIEEQRRYGAAFRDLAAFQIALRRCAAGGEALVELGLTGLADGRWAPGP